VAHFAKIENGFVTDIVFVNNDAITDENGIERESIGQDFLRSLGHGEGWLQTSYNKTFRKNFAGIGMSYDAERDAFIETRPFDSWILDENTCSWIPPVPIPDDNKYYRWEEETQSWTERGE